MRVLYAAFRHDPHDPDAASGADFQFHAALERTGAEVRVVGPYLQPEPWPERLVRRAYRRLVGLRPHKFPLSLAWRASRDATRVARAWRPDVVFSLFPPALVFYRGAAPCVLRLDTTFLGQQDGWPLYGRRALALSVWQEKRSFAHAARLLTHSEWCRRDLSQRYGVAEDRIDVFPNPAALPASVLPCGGESDPAAALGAKLQLLLVGRDFERKGVGLGLEIVRRLNEQGTPSELTVCGTRGPRCPGVRWAGTFRKNDPRQLELYLELYRQAHVLIHPAVFDASPIVTAEAAAFGVPTVTWDVGGLATSVADGESGIVLPADSLIQAWIDALTGLAHHPERYRQLRRSTRRRYQRELSWEIAGQRLAGILERTVREAGI